MTGFGTALRSEGLLLRHGLAGKLLVALPAAVAALQLLLAKAGSVGARARNLLDGDSFAAAVEYSGYGQLADSLGTGLAVLGLTVTGLAAHGLAAQRDNGSLRHLLIRRCDRDAVVVAKLLALHGLAVLACLALLATCLGLTMLLWDFAPVVEDGFELIGEAEIRRELATGLALALLPLPAMIAFGLLVGVCAPSATAAVTTALGFTIAFDALKGLLGTAAGYFYLNYPPTLLDASYLNDVGRIARGYSDILANPAAWQWNILSPWPALALYAVVSLLAFRRRAA